MGSIHNSDDDAHQNVRHKRSGNLLSILSDVMLFTDQESGDRE